MPLTGISLNLWTLFNVQNLMSALLIEKKCQIFIKDPLRAYLSHWAATLA